MNNPVPILYLEDSPRDVELLRDKLQQIRIPFELRIASDRAEYEAALAQTRFDLILSDYSLPTYDGMTALALAREKQPGVPFIIISGTLGEEQAVDCVVRGATDYVLKQNLNRLVAAVLRALSEAEENQKRRVAEESLQESEQQYRLLFQHMHAGVVVHAPDTQIILANEKACELLGLSVAQMTGKTAIDPAWRFVREDETAMPLEEYPVQRVLATRRPIRDLVVGVDRPNTKDRVWVLVNAFLEFSAHERLLHAVVTFVDITARKQVEAAQRTSAAYARSLIEASLDPLVMISVEGKITDVNEASAQATGVPREKLIGTDFTDCFTEPDKAKEGYAQVFTQGCVRDYPLTIRHSSGRITDVLYNASVYKNEAGIAQGVFAAARDITERKRAEAQREQLEEQLRMSQKMEAIGSLAGGVAHDFNNLLSVILGCTEFAMEGVRDGDPIKDNLLEVKKAGERAAALTRQLLAFSRKQVLQPAVLSLNQIATGVEKMLQRILGEDIDLVQTLAPDLGLTLADPGQIERVLINLVVNARDAMPEGGKLTIETSNVEIDEEYAARHVAVEPGSYVQLAVSDTGCGMDEQTLALIFEPFFTTKEKGKGTGLGLSTVYGIVKQSGGNIWVNSEVGQGTTFKVYLPRDFSATTPTVLKPVTITTPSRGTETILVVEDEEAMRKIALRTLSAAGYKVLTASGGDEALFASAHHAGDIHMLLTDVVMPRMSGRVLAQELSKARPTVRVLYMSGYTDNAIVNHGVLNAGTHFLAKPFTSADLTRKVREVLDEAATDGEHQPV